MLNSNTLNIKPLQTELNEWVKTPDGSLVKANAKKLHKDMDDDEITDYLPTGNTYVYSNDKKMKLKKKDFKDASYGVEYFEYIEGKNGKIPKEIKFDKWFNKKENTPAELIKNISKKIPVLDETDSNVYTNPFIRRANSFNKEYRAKPVQIVTMLNEVKKQEITGEPVNPELAQFKYGGYHNPFNPKKQFGGVLNGAASGAAAGSFAGPWGMAAGALIGGVGSYLTGSAADKAAAKREAERIELFKKLNGYNEKSFIGNNAATFAKAAIPLPKYNNLNLDSLYDRTNNTYNKLELSENSRREAGQANAFAAGNSNIRALAASGANPTDLTNYSGKVVGSGIQASNASNLQYDQLYDNYALNKTNTLNNLDNTIAQDKQRGLNITEENRYNKNMNTVGEFGNNYQDYNSKSSQLASDDYSSKIANELGASHEKSQAIGAFNNSILNAGSTIGSFKANNAQSNLLNSQANYYNSLIPNSEINNSTNNNGSYNFNNIDYLDLTNSSYQNPFNQNNNSNTFDNVNYFDRNKNFIPGSSRSSIVEGPNGLLYRQFEDGTIIPYE